MRAHVSKKLSCLLTILVLLLSLFTPTLAANKAITVSASDYPVQKDGWYSTMEEVAVYLITYDKLPGNFLTKNQAEAKGWSNREGNLDKFAPGCSIGGNHFGNYEGLVPSKKGRKWSECDINFDGGHRGAERIVFSNDGLIYYSDDHYASFTKIDVSTTAPTQATQEIVLAPVDVEKGELYSSAEEVAAYIHAFGELPVNYITKNDAKELGWTNKKDNLGTVAEGFTIGGDSFQNREKLLPSKKGRTWYECDVNTIDGKRGKQRIVFSSDGLIYYSVDNYQSFTQLY